MARRPPARVRADHVSPGPERLPDGLSARGRACLARLERTRLWPGATAEALDALTRFVREPAYRVWDPDSGCGEPLCCPHPDELRRTLAIAVHNLPRTDAGKLRARVEALDGEWRW